MKVNERQHLQTQTCVSFGLLLDECLEPDWIKWRWTVTSWLSLPGRTPDIKLRLSHTPLTPATLTHTHTHEDPRLQNRSDQDTHTHTHTGNTSLLWLSCSEWTQLIFPRTPEDTNGHTGLTWAEMSMNTTFTSSQQCSKVLKFNLVLTLIC